MHLIYLLYLMECIQLISEASWTSGMLNQIRLVATVWRNKNQPKWIEDSPSRQQIIRKRSIIDRISVYSSEWGGFPWTGYLIPVRGACWWLLGVVVVGSSSSPRVVGVIEEISSCDTRRNLLLSKNKNLLLSKDNSLFQKIKAFGHMVYDRTLHLYIHLKMGNPPWGFFW